MFWRLSYALVTCAVICGAQVDSLPVRVPFIHPSCTACSIQDYVAPDADAELLLSPQPGGRSGKIWLRRTDRELLIIGQVDGGAPRFSAEKAEVFSGDHVEVWLAAATDIPMPHIGWGNQFGVVDVNDDDGCKHWVTDKHNVEANSKEAIAAENGCREWVGTQKHYRAQFRRLFTRQWVMTDQLTIESFALPAYHEIATKYAIGGPGLASDIPEVLKPRPGVSLRRDQTCCETGYGFVVSISYGAFPPIPDLAVRDLWIMVDVFNRALPGTRMGPYATTAPGRRYGASATFNRVQLDPPLQYKVTPCEYPLRKADGDAYAWLLPGERPDQPQSDTVEIANEAAGYRYDPDGLSPVVETNHHVWRSVGSDETVCGPKLAYAAAGKTKRYQNYVDFDFSEKRVGGLLLIKTGPKATHTQFGAGQCGACPISVMQMLVIDPQMNIVNTLDLGGDMADTTAGDGIDFSVSQDWRQITRYRLSRDNTVWSSETYCMNDNKYPEVWREQ